MLFRAAKKGDLPEIVALLADDALGQSREDPSVPLREEYGRAFDEITAQAGNQVIVAVDQSDRICACLQITFVPGLARLGAKRATIEGVRVAADQRGSGLGQQLFEHAIYLAREAGCSLVQLTTDKSRPDAARFYQRLGFEASHEGMKLSIY